MSRAEPSIAARVTPEPPTVVTGEFERAGKSRASKFESAGHMCSLAFLAKANVSGDFGSPQSRVAAVTAAAIKRSACFLNLTLNG